MERPDLKCSTGAVRDDRCCLWCYLTAHVYDNIAPSPVAHSIGCTAKFSGIAA